MLGLTAVQFSVVYIDKAFLSGLKRSIDISWLHLFDAVDVQYLISGRKQRKYNQNYVLLFSTLITNSWLRCRGSKEPYRICQPILRQPSAHPSFMGLFGTFLLIICLGMHDRMISSTDIRESPLMTSRRNSCIL